MSWLNQLVTRSRRYNELSESIREHVEEKIESLIDGGVTREEAERSARREFGNVTLIEERSREVWQWRRLENIWADIRFALRQLWKSPGFAFTTILTLALGIAATVAIFGFVDSTLIRPLPYRTPSRLVAVFESIRQSHRTMFSHPNYLDLERFNSGFASTAAYDVRRNFVLTDASGAQQVNGIGVTGKFFRTLGVTPALGGDFDTNFANEDLPAASATVLLSYAAWQKRFDGKPDVLGKTVTLIGQPYTVIGVLPRNFQFAPTGATEFWTTLHPYATDPCELQRGCHVMNVVARLKNGVTLQQAFANAQSILTQDAKRYPNADRDDGANIVSLSQVILGDIQPILLALLGAAGLLLLIAFVNVASLLLVRSENRRHEFAVRGALGAARERLVQQFVTEGLVMVGASTALGLLIAGLANRLLLKLIPTELLNSMPYLRESSWNWHLTAFATVLILIACCLFAATPALRLPFADLRAGLIEGDRRAAGMAWRNLGARLIVLELATTMVLLVGAGLLGKSFYKLLHVNIGFVPSHLAMLQILAPESKYSRDEQAIALQREIVGRLQSLPGAIGAGMAKGLPVGWEGSTSIGFAGKPNLGEGHEVGNRQISAGYFSVLEAQLLKGRYFNENDNATARHVTIINQSLAQQYFPGEDPIGKQIFFHGQPEHPMQIVGMVTDVKEGALDEKEIPFMYIPFEQNPAPIFGIAVRTSQEAASVLPSLIATIHKIDPGIATFDVAHHA